MNNDWESALAAFYREVDREIASRDPACGGCGECCRFDRADHALYASRLERRYLVKKKPAGLRTETPPELLAAGLRCPFQSGDSCQAREARVLGCRLHFCSWPDQAAAEELAEHWHRRLKRLHDELREPWEYAPLFPLDRQA